MLQNTRTHGPISMGSIIATLLFALLLPSTASSQEINSWLMNSTFRIEGPSKNLPGHTTFGTVFIVGKPIGSPNEKGQQSANYVLVTAAHVLDGIAGEQAVITLRRKNVDGTYGSFPFTVKIRNGPSILYMIHPNADVAVMYIELPNEVAITLLSTQLFADDDRLTQLEVHPGDELFCLGFPLYLDLLGFPVVRSGVLASYPITPSKTVKTLYYNFHVFRGNSGGPVYFDFANRSYAGSTHIGHEWGIIGLVSQQVSSTLFPDEKLDTAVIVPSSFIIDAIGMLPPKQTVAQFPSK